MEDRRVYEVLRHLHPAPGVKLWHGGASLLGALRGVSAKVAAWKPYPERHSIWELALHIAYWNYAVERRINDTPRGEFPRTPANWPDVPDRPADSAWKEDRRLVRHYHDRLVETVAAFDTSRLDRLADSAGDTRTTYADLITGILVHDTYHVGQIQLMKRLAQSHGLVRGK